MILRDIFNAKFIYQEEKNSILLETRVIGFDAIIKLILDGHLLYSEDNPNHAKYPNQKVLYVRMIEEVYVVPCIVEKDGTIFLKTLFPSRKARKKNLQNK